MRFHVLAVFSREPDGQKFQDRFIADTTIKTDIDSLRQRIVDWLREIFHEEPVSTKLISLSHARID